MKIKKFTNLWAMGLILFGAILVALYIAKIFFPEFVISVAENEHIVAFGNYVDTHWWAYYLFNFAFSYACAYFFCSACCRTMKLKPLYLLIILIATVVIFLAQAFLPQYSLVLNMVIMLATPIVILFLEKENGIEYLYSTSITYIAHFLCQLFTLEIRGISTLISYPNSATFTILTIDGFILLVFLCKFFRKKGV